MPSFDELIKVKAGPCSTAGGWNSIAVRPQTSCTSSRITKDRPKVIKSSGTWPNLCTRRSAKRSNAAPSAPTSSGAITSAGQKPHTLATV